MNNFEIDPKQLLDDFLAMVKIDSPSQDERAIADWLTERFRELGCEVEEDSAGQAVSGNAGNLRVLLKGNRNDVQPLLFSAHMDTVEPARGIEPVVADGVVRSKGDTVLGADDKAGLAIILHLARMAKLQPDVPRPDLEFSIHVCEEIGLLGAKNVDTSKFKAVAGFILDDHDPKGVTIKCPAAVRLDYRVIGRASHAGVEPEKGISALKVAAEAIAKMKMGRIDEETTANIGVIKGGRASNIVVEEIEMKAEARSHDPQKLEAQVEHMNDCFEETCAAWRKPGDNLPRFVPHRADDYKAVKLTEDDYPVTLAIAAGKKLGWSIETKIGGGGTDGSILTHKGIPCLVVGVGMQDAHSTKEHIEIANLEDAARLAGAIAVAHAERAV